MKCNCVLITNGNITVWCHGYVYDYILKLSNMYHAGNDSTAEKFLHSDTKKIIF